MWSPGIRAILRPLEKRATRPTPTPTPTPTPEGGTWPRDAGEEEAVLRDAPADRRGRPSDAKLRPIDCRAHAPTGSRGVCSHFRGTSLWRRSGEAILHQSRLTPGLDEHLPSG